MQPKADMNFVCKLFNRAVCASFVDLQLIQQKSHPAFSSFSLPIQRFSTWIANLFHAIFFPTSDPGTSLKSIGHSACHSPCRRLSWHYCRARNPRRLAAGRAGLGGAELRGENALLYFTMAISNPHIDPYGSFLK